MHSFLHKHLASFRKELEAKTSTFRTEFWRNSQRTEVVSFGVVHGGVLKW